MVKKLAVNKDDPWWVIALKVVAYLIQLILAGGAGAAASQLGQWTWF